MVYIWRVILQVLYDYHLYIILDLEKPGLRSGIRAFISKLSIPLSVTASATAAS